MTNIESYQADLLTAVNTSSESNWLDVLVSKGFEINPHARGTEFEVKYAPTAAEADLGAYARRLLTSNSLPSSLLVPEWIVFSESVIEYWLVNGIEWSKQDRADGTTVLKRKVHEVFLAPITGVPLVQSKETFVRDPHEITRTIMSLGKSVGVLRKTRAKGHYVHLSEGVVFNLVESRCYVDDLEQVQLELEYGAHLHHRLQTPSPMSSTEKVRELLWTLHDMLEPVFDDVGLVTTTELKSDFARAAAAG